MKILTQSTALEVRILEWLQNNRPQIAEQIKKSRIIKREYSGAGFFFTFSIPIDVAKISPEVKTIEGPAIKSNRLHSGGNSIVFCEDGYIKMLEIFGYDREFPENLEEFELQ